MVRLAAVGSCLNLALIIVTSNGASAITDAGAYSALGEPSGHQNVLLSESDREKYNTACPDYRHYSAFPQYVCLALFCSCV